MSSRATAYSPDRRTAVVLSGTGVHGAYHAGVLRALQEAGVKIDVLGGHGIGAANAAVAAIDGQARLWESGGIWSQSTVGSLYQWKRPIRVSGWLLVVLLVVVIAPFALVLASGLVAYALGFLLEMTGSGRGTGIIAVYSSWLQWAFAAENLPTIVPRLATLIVMTVVVMLCIASLTGAGKERRVRAPGGALLWRLLGAPLDSQPARAIFSSTIWRLIRGAGGASHPSDGALGRQYADVLAESLGQPGFREIVLVATDIDERRDVTAALLREPFRRDFMVPRPNRDRRAEVLDLGDTGRERTIDVVAAALTPPVACDPHLVTFASNSAWRGEAHRLCDRPGAISRLLEEVAAAGVSQAIVVSANASTAGPHRLQSSRLDLRHRIGEFIVAAESAALRDALEMARLRFDSVYVIAPAHNPLGPFDVAGTYDESSDRRYDVSELLERGYEDAYRQFIEPVVGASGDHLARRVVAGKEARGGLASA